MARVLIITYEFPPLGGGTGKAALGTARALTRLGHEVAVMTSRFQGLAAEEMVDGIRIFRIPVLRRYLNKANAVEVMSFAASGVIAARGVMKKFAPELSLAYLTIPSGIVAMEFRRLAGIPCITLLRGQDVPGYPEPHPWLHRLAWPVTGSIWRKSHAVVANSSGLADLAKAAAPGLDIGLLYNAVDTDHYRPDPTRIMPPLGEAGALRIVYIGRLVKFKRVRELVKAWKLVLEKTTVPVELHIAGFGPERSRLEELIAQHNLTESVRLRGRINESEVIRLLQSADVFVSPSEMEGLPNSVIEAMACGVPVVLSDIGPHRELVANNDAGILCAAADPVALAEAMLRVIESPQLRMEMGRRGRAIIEERFTWDPLAERLVGMFPK